MAIQMGLRITWLLRWAKQELAQTIADSYINLILDEKVPLCYTEEKTSTARDMGDEDIICLPREYLPQSHGGVRDETACAGSGNGGLLRDCLRRHQLRGSRESRLRTSPA